MRNDDGKKKNSYWSQSLFQQMVFCNLHTSILVIGLLYCHNPYFSRWFSAILKQFLNKYVPLSHNPYFSRWFSAITNIKCISILCVMSQSLFQQMVFCNLIQYLGAWNLKKVTILILVDGFLQSYTHNKELKANKSQSLFQQMVFCNNVNHALNCFSDKSQSLFQQMVFCNLLC